MARPPRAGAKAEGVEVRTNCDSLAAPTINLILRSGPKDRVSKDGPRVIGAFLYILRCADGSYYVGTTRKTLEARVAEHDAGLFGGYTAMRRPVTLAFAQQFESVADAIAAERQVKGWSHAKKEALMRGDWEAVSVLAQRHAAHPSRRPLEPVIGPRFARTR